MSPQDRIIIQRAAWDRWQIREQRRRRVHAVLGLGFIALAVGCAAIASWRTTMWLCDLVMRQLMGAP